MPNIVTIQAQKFLVTYPLSPPSNIVTTTKSLTISTYPVNGVAQYIIEDLYELAPGNIVELFELDLTGIVDDSGNPGTVYRFHSGTNELNTNVVWQGNIYYAFPIEADGFETSTEGKLPKPKIKVANIDQALAALNRTFKDLVGGTLIRKRTLLKYLDAVNFPASINPTADPSQYLPDDIFYVNRKTSENRVFIEYELSSSIDVEGIKLPRRQIVQNVCTWKYRSSECSYAGSNYWDADGNPVVTFGADVCGKKLSDCQLRFGENNELPYGGFPGAGLF